MLFIDQPIGAGLWRLEDFVIWIDCYRTDFHFTSPVFLSEELTFCVVRVYEFGVFFFCEFEIGKVRNCIRRLTEVVAGCLWENKEE